MTKQNKRERPTPLILLTRQPDSLFFPQTEEKRDGRRQRDGHNTSVVNERSIVHVLFR